MVVVQYILPALRGAIAKELVDHHRLMKSDVASRMGVTAAAVTQYLGKTRGDAASSAIGRSSTAIGLVSEIASDLAEGKSPSDMVLAKMCKACRALQTEGLICELHKEEMPSLKQVDSCACSLRLVNQH